jgi:Yip1 domain
VRIITRVPVARLNPWWSMWIYPRATTRQILNRDSMRMVPLFAAIYGVSVTLDHASLRGVPEEMPPWGVLILALLFGPLMGQVVVYVGGAIVGAIGRRLGGVGTRQEVQIALAWSYLPNLEMLLLWVPWLALFGHETFRNSSPTFDAWSDAQPYVVLPLVFLLLAVSIAAAVWTFIIRLKCIAEAHQFSAWRSLASLLVLILPFWFLTVVAICSGVLASLQQPM